MLLSTRYQFLFIHIAKTGGTSIRAALRRRIWADPDRFFLWMVSRLSGWTGHRLGIKFPRHAKAIAAKEMLPGDVFDRLFKFTFVRNPWDLQVSSFHHVRRERPGMVAEAGVASFDDFIRWKFDPERPFHYILDASTEPQHLSTIDLYGNCIVDFIGRYERLEADYHHVCGKIGLKPPPQLPHRRQSKSRGGYRAYYSDATAELIGSRYQADIENFGYRFDA